MAVAVLMIVHAMVCAMSCWTYSIVCVVLCHKFIDILISFSLVCATTTQLFGTNLQQKIELCECTATFLHEKRKKTRFYFVIREIMVIFALENKLFKRKSKE